MALRGAVARFSSSAIRTFETRPLTLSASRSFATIDDKERAEEKVHFKQEDEKLLRALLNKVKKQADADDAKSAADADAVETKALNVILGKYKVSDEDLKALIAWKHAST